MGGVTTRDVPAVHQPRTGVGTTAKGRSASLRDKRAMLALKILLPLAVVVWLFRVGIPGASLVPVWGPSMRPTMAVWHVPAPLESLSFSGWVHYDPDREPEIGNIVYFKVPNTRFREVKRVAKINEEGALWVTPDNSGISGEGSDNSELYDWIPRDDLIGVVDDVYTPARFFRTFSSYGQLRNWVEMRCGPGYVKWRDLGLLVATVEEDLVRVWNNPDSSVFSSPFRQRVPDADYACEWRNGRLVLMFGDLPHIYALFDPETGRNYKFDASRDKPREFQVDPVGRVFVRANAEGVIALRARGIEPRIRVDGEAVVLVSPGENNSFAEWSGTAKLIGYENCLFEAEGVGR